MNTASTQAQSRLQSAQRRPAGSQRAARAAGQAHAPAKGVEAAALAKPGAGVAGSQSASQTAPHAGRRETDSQSGGQIDGPSGGLNSGISAPAQDSAASKTTASSMAIDDSTAVNRQRADGNAAANSGIATDSGQNVAVAETTTGAQPARTADRPTPDASLLPWENGVIDIFVNVAQLIGIPKSVGQIYGLLFCREQPLPMDDIIEVLQISKGSASQGLRMLRHLNAVHIVSLRGDRRDHYEAERALRKLVSGFLSEQIEPHLATGRKSLETLGALSADLPAEARVAAQKRISTLRAWNDKTAKLLPMLRLFL